MHSKWVLPALPLCLCVAFVTAQPACHADWRDSLIRSMAPRLVDRTFDYLLRDRSRRAAAPPTSAAPRWVSTTGAARPAPKTTTGRATGAATQASSGSGTSAGNSRAASAAVPPPPQTLVPPPPPGVPTGAILGLYPQQMNVDPEALSASLKPPRKGAPPPPRIVLDKPASPPATQEDDDAPMPKPAPDFHRRSSR